jgi:hypothetical protein
MKFIGRCKEGWKAGVAAFKSYKTPEEWERWREARSFEAYTKFISLFPLADEAAAFASTVRSRQPTEPEAASFMQHVDKLGNFEDRYEALSYICRLRPKVIILRPLEEWTIRNSKKIVEYSRKNHYGARGNNWPRLP